MSIVKIDNVGQDSLDRATKVLAGISGGIDKAVRSAMNRATTYLKSNAGKIIRERYAISQQEIRANQNITVSYNYGDGLQASVRFAGNKIPLYRYDGTYPKIPTKDTTRLVPVRVGNKWITTNPNIPTSAHQLKTSALSHYDRAFTLRMKSGHVGIFERTGGVSSTGSDSIRELMGSSIPQMLGNPEVQQKLTNEAIAKFDERLDHEVQRILNGWGD